MCERCNGYTFIYVTFFRLFKFVLGPTFFARILLSHPFGSHWIDRTFLVRFRSFFGFLNEKLKNVGEKQKKKERKWNRPVIISNIEIKKLSCASQHRARSTESAHINTKINVCCVSACAGMCERALVWERRECEKRTNQSNAFAYNCLKIRFIRQYWKVVWYMPVDVSVFILCALYTSLCTYMSSIRSVVRFIRSLACSRTLVIFMDFMSPWKFRGHGEVVTFLFVVVMINEQHPKHGSQR